MHPESVRQRRGGELEAALLEAAWQEVVERGYAALTLDAVAARAGTSRPVLARRWAGKAELVRAAVQHVLAREPTVLPDTGSLRGDLLAVMREANANRASNSAFVVHYLGGYFQETGTSLADLRQDLLAGRGTGLDELFERAIARGEVDAARLTPRVRSLPVDLYRHEALMTLRPVPEEVLAEILDEIYLPLVASARG